MSHKKMGESEQGRGWGWSLHSLQGWVWIQVWILLVPLCALKDP